MESDRWANIERLYHAALEREPAERDAFLDKQPKYATYLNLIEPWWKTLRSLALKGRRFESWEEIVKAIEEATAYWNKHRHPYAWGRRRRHQPCRRSGIARLPKAA